VPRRRARRRRALPRSRRPRRSSRRSARRPPPVARDEIREAVGRLDDVTLRIHRRADGSMEFGDLLKPRSRARRTSTEDDDDPGEGQGGATTGKRVAAGGPRVGASAGEEFEDDEIEAEADPKRAKR